MPKDEPTNAIRRVVYHEITAGDRRKFVARSNDAATGGGARDLRFSYRRFRDVFSQLFPKKRIEQRRRGGVRKQEEIFVGEIHWYDAERQEKTMEATFESPTDVRPSEGRLTKVHTYPYFANTPLETEGMVLLLLIQNGKGEVWPHFVSERSLRAPGWNRDVAGRILACINAKRRNVAVKGYMDFETGQSFCNAG